MLDPDTQKLSDLTQKRLSDPQPGSLLQVFISMIEASTTLEDEDWESCLVFRDLHLDKRHPSERLSKVTLSAIHSQAFADEAEYLSDRIGPNELPRVPEVVSVYARNSKRPEYRPPTARVIPRPLMIKIHAWNALALAAEHLGIRRRSVPDVIMVAGHRAGIFPIEIQWIDRARIAEQALVLAAPVALLVLVQDPAESEAVELMETLMRRSAADFLREHRNAHVGAEEIAQTALGDYYADPPDYLAVEPPQSLEQAVRYICRTVDRKVSNAVELLRRRDRAPGEPAPRTLRARRKQGVVVEPPQGVSRAEAARQLGVDTTTLKRMEKRGDIHPTKGGGRGVYYSASDIVRAERALAARGAKRNSDD